MRFPLRFIPRDLALPILQGPLRGQWWYAGSSNHGCWLGSYEFEKQRLLARMLAPGQVMFDLGANVGFYTLLAARRVGPGGRVVAFEPLEGNVAYLRRHLRRNAVANVEVIQAAVADRPGTARFAPHRSNAMGRLSDSGDLEVPVVSLDALFEAGSLPRPDVLKIDIEGAELRALRGAERLLRTARPCILLATHGPELRQACCDLLRGLGYVVTTLDDSEAGADEIVAHARR